ncbi:MAG: septal ring lytic transglycosylase RlpA family protein [Candidatus Binatus sp.]|uniref:septal ring lytic transglycosylase RlpA family protein n=1 Tax=Candidatus Binatus sp. TaxID=2811406 RepID=UPI0027260B4E|nr:septal ring lytic transglycosylase RlpA family protein [Candidatus Binatus sp.]MDO8434032.1 septal ring lytic transglycosylase RlpA family protein [Candidatus Binatus sp.]
MRFNQHIHNGLLSAILGVGALCLPWNASAEMPSPRASENSSRAAAQRAQSTGSRVVSNATEPGDVVKGKASWYGPGLHGKKTATGERFNSNAMTAASNHVPLGSEVIVTNLENGKSARVRINDCGPPRRGRKIDLSKKAAHKLDMAHDGTAPVKAEVVSTPAEPETCDGLKKASR